MAPLGVLTILLVFVTFLSFASVALAASYAKDGDSVWVMPAAIAVALGYLGYHIAVALLTLAVG